MEIRVLSEDDLEDYTELRLRALKEEPEAFGASYEESSKLSREEVADRLASSDDGFILGAFDESTGLLLAMVGFYRNRPAKMKHKGAVWGMYTVPEARGLGVGRALMVELIERAKVIDGLETLLITVVVENKAAYKLYKSLGFKEYAIECGALKVDDKYLDEAFMSMPLS